MLLPEGKAPLATLFDVHAWPVPRREEPGALRALVEEAIDAVHPSLLVVDALPGGVLEELRPLPASPRRALLLRLHTKVDDEQGNAFEDVLDLEAHLAWRPRDVRAEAFPPVTRDLAPNPTRVDVALFAGEDARLLGFCERLSARVRARGHTVALIAGAPRTPYALEGYAPRVVVGAAGFNLTYEALRARAWHLAVPRARAFDDQRRRARSLAEIPRGPRELERRVLAYVAEGPRPPGPELSSMDTLAERLLQGAPLAAL